MGGEQGHAEAASTEAEPVKDVPSAETRSGASGSSAAAVKDKRTERGYGSRTGRVVESSAAIFWSVVVLIFLNYFNQYIAYYHDGIREPFLTSDFALWLPLLNATLILTVIGHIILIIFDRHILREIIQVILYFGLLLLKMSESI